MIGNIQLDSQTLTMDVLRLPNEAGVSLVDNQVEYPPENDIFLHDMEEASRYGTRVLGTLCDLRAITDEKGFNLLGDYHVSTERKGASLVDTFCVPLLETGEAPVLHIELIFGVNEDLSARFKMAEPYRLDIPMKN